MDAADRLVRSRIKLQQKNPFFAYLSLGLKFQEDKGMLPEQSAGMGVAADGTLIYSKEFVEKLGEQELMGCLIHEILHLSLLHLLRVGSRNHIAYNISADILVNKVLLDNGYKLPAGLLIPDGEIGSGKENQITLKFLGGQVIKDLDKKTSEIIYDELKIPKQSKMKIGIAVSGGNQKGKKGNPAQGQGNGNGSGNYQGFDYHIFGKDGKELTEKEKADLEREWINKVEEGYVVAKLRGSVPLGIERLIGKLHENKINWKSLLQRYIQSYLPSDFTWAKPNKKSVSAGYYMPDLIKERINICVGIDTSGSIGQEELVDFISEIIGIAKAFRGSLRVRLMTHDVDVHTDYVVENGNIAKIKELQIKGGGGTSHKPIFDFIKEKERDAKLAVFFTDGESDLDSIKFENYKFDKIFLISKEGDDRQLKNKRCKVIKLDK